MVSDRDARAELGIDPTMTEVAQGCWMMIVVAW